MSTWRAFTYELTMMKAPDDLWPTNLITPAGLVEGVLQRCEVAEMNGEPLKSTNVLRNMLRIMKALEIWHPRGA